MIGHSELQKNFFLEFRVPDFFCFQIRPISIIFESFNSIFQRVAELQPSNFVNLGTFGTPCITRAHY